MDALIAILNSTILYLKQVISLFWVKVILAILAVFVYYVLDMYQAQRVAIDMLVMFMIIDFIFWFTISLYKWTTSSFRLWIWLWKFVAYFIVVLIWYAFDMMLFWQSLQYWVHYFFIVYLWITELISISEHLHEIWIDLPFIRDLKKIRKEMQHKSISEIVWDKLDMFLHHSQKQDAIQKEIDSKEDKKE